LSWSAMESTQCLLHPLAVLNISDHYSRSAARAADETQRAAVCVIGGLIGSQKGTEIEVFNSFELFVDASGVVNVDYLVRKAAHYKNVFHEHDVVGWYCAPKLASNFEANRTTIAEHSGNANLISLVLDPHTVGTDAYPFSAETPDAHPLNVKVASTDAEKIGIDHIARTVPKGGSASLQLTAHLGGVHSAVGKLSEGIQAICAYLQAVKSGKVPKDQVILRQVRSLCNRLPAGDANAKEKLLQDYNDVLLVTYLASLTKAANESNELVEKFNTVHEKHRRHRPF